MLKIDCDQSVRQSLASLGGTPLLKKGEDIELAKIYQKDPQSPEGITAKNKLISANLRLVAYVAKQHPHRGELADRIQDGVIGLIRAAEQYDPGLGNAFTTYAFHWIRQQIIWSDEVSGNVVRLPAYQAANVKKIRQAYCALALEGRSPNLDQISEITGITSKSLPLAIEATKFIKGQIFSTSVLVGLLKNETLESLLPDPGVAIEAVAEAADRAAKITELLDNFSSRQQQIIRQLYGLDCEILKPGEIASALGISSNRVCQIRKSVFKTIRNTPRLNDFARSLLD